MRRALELAAKGRGNTSPNPMVGAVIVGSDGLIIGEGYHRLCGQGHAEVNAVASVADRSQLADSTMYVTLEPCSHYGKTPPCARLIIESGIPRVVVGCLDPFEKVSGRGVAMLREAGVDVEVASGEIADECHRLNRRFMTAHTLRRPFVTLKWAMSADGFMDSTDPEPYRFSTPLTSLLVHRERSLHDAVVVGSGTVVADNPRLDVRGWSGRQPVKVVLDRRGRVEPSAALFSTPGEVMVESGVTDIPELLRGLYGRGITSVLVEGGAEVLRSFLDSGMWDTARVEVAPVALGSRGAVKAPAIPAGTTEVTVIDGNTIYRVDNDAPGC